MKRWNEIKKIIAIEMAFLMVCLFLVPEKISSLAKDSFSSGYMQTVFNQKNGIGSNEVNCLYQSSSGYVWLGTDGGLYRSNGSGFQSINLWNTERTDVYSINCITQDKDGRMWIGTSNYGLFYIENGENYHLQEEYYNGIKTIYKVCQAEDGTIYAATERGLFVCEQDENMVMRLIPFENEDVASRVFTDIAIKDNSIWAIENKSQVYVITNNIVQYTINTKKHTNDDLRSICELEGKIYIGTSGNNVLCYRSQNSYEVMPTSVDGINRIMLDNYGYIWVCAENGLGYFNNSGTFIKVNDCKIDTYLSDILQDYEGNYWISSSRMGVLLLSKSKFVDYNLLTGMQDTMVNNVISYNGNTYIGTEDGLVIYDQSKEKITNELTDMLSGVSVRYFMIDSEGDLWISTYRRYGVIKLSKDGSIENYGRNVDLPSNSMSCTLELEGGNVAVAMDSGIAIIDKKGKIISIYGRTEGIEYTNITCLYQDDNHLLYAGSEGGGIYQLEPGLLDSVVTFTTENGLNSNYISSIVEGNQGIWIGTDNGLCFYNEAFRQISNIEISNSIYDIDIQDDKLWIISSMGIISGTEDDLLNSVNELPRYFDENDGLLKDINNLGKVFIDQKGIMYVCCNTGLCTLDTRDIYYNTVAPRIRVISIDADGKEYEFDDLADGLKVDSDVARVSIKFAVFSYSNRENIKVEYSLKGFDEQPITISGTDTMEAVYTNLKGGTYEFEITAYNGDGTVCEKTLSFVIEKEKSLIERTAVKIAFAALLLVGFVAAIFMVVRIRTQLRKKNVVLEQLSKEHAEAIKSSNVKNDYLANMSNEIKIPINAMLVKADEVLQSLPADDENRERIQSICNTGNEILEKVDDIILLAKIEAGRVELTNNSYSITSVVSEIAEEAITKVGDKIVKFFVEISDDLQDLVIGDQGKIKDIVSRMVDNAIKYTKEGSITLSIDCYKYEDKQNENMVNVTFTVSDTGIGIQEERLENIFDVYGIVDNMKSSLKSGNGVGLAIAKGYADLMEGEMEVESAYGAGSTFSFSVKQKIAEKSKVGHNISKIEGTVSKETADKLWLPEVEVLLVDDDAVSREVTRKVLTSFDMKVDETETGIQAIDMVMNKKYDVVFMDISMPVMSGVDAMREIREIDEEHFGQLPIIAMDTDAIEENKANYLSAGFTDSVLKPVDNRRIAAILKDCLPETKIAEKPTEVDMGEYVDGVRYLDGLMQLQNYLDVEMALEKIGGTVDVFNKLINVYFNQNVSASEELYEKVGKDARGFRTKIHAIRIGSLSIGATKISKAASSIESAINIGNMYYVNENLDQFTSELQELISVLSQYLEYVHSVENMTDEEYLKKKEEDVKQTEQAEENLEEMDLTVISKELLESLKQAALDGNNTVVDKIMDGLTKGSHFGEDKEFVEVLSEACGKREVETICELVTTYMDLMS